VEKRLSFVMSKILDKLADQHEERILNVLVKLEEDVVKEVTRATGGKLVSQRLAIQLRPAIRNLIQTTFLEEADIIINEEYNKIAKEVLDTFGEMPIPKKFKSLTEVDLATINALKTQSFSGFEDIAERFLKVINDEVYQSTIAGRPFEDMVSNIRSHINGVYKQSNVTEINELVDFINENKFDDAKKLQVEEAVRKLHTQYASDRAGNNLRRYAGQIAHDSVMQFHGQFTVAKAKASGLNHFTYTGTLVRDSREFCVNMLNKTLTEEQIRDMWNNRSWQGKSTGDPFIVRGGYRCRHTWIPTDPSWGEETVDELPTEEELPPPPPVRGVVSDIPIAFLLNRGSDNLRKAYDDDFNSQLTDQQKIIVGKFDKPNEIKNSKNGVYYSSTKELRAELDAKDGDIKGKEVKSYVIAHEYGHHLDYVTNKSRVQAWSETNDDFRKAIIDDRKAFKGKVLRGKYVIDKEELDKLYKKIGTRDIKEVYSKSNPERLLSSYPTTVLKGDGYGEVSDIIDALAYGKFQRTYNTWGHGQSYYKRRGSIEKEIFANLFSLRNDKKAYALTKSIIPNTVKEFEKRLDELEKQ
jgi:hypothetical protein